MSYVANTLRRLLDEKGMRPADFAKAAKVQESLVSRVLNGSNRLSEESLKKVAGWFYESTSRLDAGEIVAAHLMDCRTAPGSEFVKITITEGKQLKGNRPLAEASPKLERALEYLKDACGGNEALGKLIIQLAEVNGMGKS